MDFWKNLPAKDTLLKTDHSWMVETPDVNAHLHTPYSFSAFDTIEQVFKMAKEENVKVVGINDFFTMDGYAEWAKFATIYQVLPLFNIEFVGLSEEEQVNGVRINDPNNPGRIYVSGKGLTFPVRLQEPYSSQLANVKRDANRQVKEMCDALNKHLSRVGVDLRFSYNAIEEKFTKGLARERHLAKAVREEVFLRHNSDQDRLSALKQIFEGQEVKSEISDDAALENEIRSRLLKAGGPAFIPENAEQFLSLAQIRELILKAGGIPTYPLLADSLNGGYTEFEEDKEALMKKLVDKGIFSIEFIPNRNSMESLLEYAGYFSERGFLVTMGSEHNTPALLPIRLFDKAKKQLSEPLKRINFEGAAITAAHQYLKGNDQTGFLDDGGAVVPGQREELIKLGTRLIHFFNSHANDIIKL